MFSKFTFLFLMLGLTLVSSKLQDVEFLNEISQKYSPPVVGRMMLKRIEGRMNEVKRANRSRSMTADQHFLCTSIYNALDTLHHDVELMDKSPVLCGNQRFEKVINYFLGKFKWLLNLYNKGSLKALQ
ncbi:uncharacterized protein LOC107366998 [Tetranychus urticae]|uniref:uncharacterized protein LOC107366998 n=1 Tax=Tetranychus urticae TaxID=32264 RepID=UPI00077BA5FE|nr:uncharacterized protein LOC107366998 [Tetranychus urticae]